MPMKKREFLGAAMLAAGALPAAGGEYEDDGRVRRPTLSNYVRYRAADEVSARTMVGNARASSRAGSAA